MMFNALLVVIALILQCFNATTYLVNIIFNMRQHHSSAASIFLMLSGTEILRGKLRYFRRFFIYIAVSGAHAMTNGFYSLQLNRIVCGNAADKFMLNIFNKAEDINK